jgi:hypothetical protein
MTRMSDDELRRRSVTYRRRTKVRTYLRRGAPAFVDAAPAWAHVDAFIAEGWSEFRVAQAAGVLAQTLHQRLPTMHASRAAALLNVTREQLYKTAGDLDRVPAIGARRRLQALGAIGHPLSHIVAYYVATEALKPETMHISGKSWRIIRDAYNRLSMTNGTRLQARNRAKAAGWAPPLAWDDDSIDDPAAVAVGAR